jgi:hypothetical protein
MQINIITTFDAEHTNTKGPSSLLLSTTETFNKYKLKYNLVKVNPPTNYILRKLFQLGLLPIESINYNKNDIYFVYPYWCIKYIHPNMRKRAVVLAPDLQSLLFTRLLKHKNYIINILYHIIIFILRRYENTLMKQVYKVLFVGRADNIHYFCNSKGYNGIYVPHPITNKTYNNIRDSRWLNINQHLRKKTIILLSGAGGEKYFGDFINQIFEEILNSNILFKANILLLGKDKLDLYNLYKLKLPNINYLEWLDDYASLYYNNHIVQIIPLTVGVGTKQRILEALAFNADIVTTSIGLENCEEFLKTGNIVISDSPKQFCKLIENKVLNKFNSTENYNSIKEIFNDRQVDYESAIVEIFLKINRNITL